MEFFTHKTQINFMAQRKWAALASIILFLFSLLSLTLHGLNWGLDFTGGMQIQLNFPEEANLTQIRTRLQQANLNNAVVMSYGTSHDVLITLAVRSTNTPLPLTSQQPDKLKDAQVAQIAGLLPTAKVMQVNYIGPQVGHELATKGALAIVIALLGTMIYIAIRFEFRFAISSTIALIHDPILILGIFSLLHIEFNLITLAAVLTVIGYSLNDTIVIFDRVRENFRRLRKAEPITVVNLAINQTLSRTLMTSALTLMVVLTLFFLGGSMLHGFALALIIGIVIGTYSSIYVAGSLALALGLEQHHLLPVTLDTKP